MSDRSFAEREASQDLPVRGLHGQVVQSLGREIVSGQRTPGETLDLDQLEAKLGVSRSVLREALRVLTAKGLVAARPKRGTYICEKSQWRMLDRDLLRWRRDVGADEMFLEDLAELRRVVEPAVAELAALRRSEADIEAMESFLAAMERAHTSGDHEGATEADLSFHRALLAASGNELLQQMEPIIVTALDSRDRLVHGTPGWQDATPQHRTVFDAVAAGDSAAARDRMLKLIERSGRDAERALGEQQAP